MNSNEALSEDLKSLRKHHRRRCLWRIPILAAFLLLQGALVLILWNALIPDLFHGPVVNYAQSLGLLVLARLLVGFHGHRPFGGRGGHGGQRSELWKARMMSMSPEERQKLRSEFGRRCQSGEHKDQESKD